jgi:hypothetical protein
MSQSAETGNGADHPMWAITPASLTHPGSAPRVPWPSSSANTDRGEACPPYALELAAVSKLGSATPPPLGRLDDYTDLAGLDPTRRHHGVR